MRLRPALLFAALIGMPCAALPATDARQSFLDVRQCVKDENVAQCRTLLTRNSLELYNRFTSYGIMGCLPKDAAYFSQKTSGSDVIIRASVTSAGQKRYMNLVFSRESGAWKLNVPASLQKGLGPQWEQNVAMVEKIYLLLHEQMGASLNCAAIQNLGNQASSQASN